MTTYCEQFGLKVGDKIRFLGPDCHNSFKVDDVLTLCKDDGTDAPMFHNQCNEVDYLDLSVGEWEKVHVVEVVSIQAWKYNEKVFTDHDELLQHLAENLSAKELLTYLNEHCTIAFNK